MTKKERRKLKEIATSPTWLVTREEVKREFVKRFITDHKELRKKDKKEVIFILLGIRV